jgi:hypothetical protein
VERNQLVCGTTDKQEEARMFFEIKEDYLYSGNL